MIKIVIAVVIYFIVGAAVSGIICAVDKKIKNNEQDFAEIIAITIFYPFLFVVSIIYLISSFFTWLAEKILNR